MVATYDYTAIIICSLNGYTMFTSAPYKLDPPPQGVQKREYCNPFLHVLPLNVQVGSFHLRLPLTRTIEQGTY